MLTAVRDSVGVGFVDLSGFTDFTDRVGDLKAFQLVLRLCETLERNLEGTARIVKHLGDGALVFADHPADAEATIARTISAWNAHAALPLRGAVGTGTALEVDGDIYGGLVNHTAHLLNRAMPGTVEVREFSRAQRGFSHQPRPDLHSPTGR